MSKQYCGLNNKRSQLAYVLVPYVLLSCSRQLIYMCTCSWRLFALFLMLPHCRATLETRTNLTWWSWTQSWRSSRSSSSSWTFGWTWGSPTCWWSTGESSRPWRRNSSLLQVRPLISLSCYIPSILTDSIICIFVSDTYTFVTYRVHMIQCHMHVLTCIIINIIDVELSAFSSHT